MKAQRHALLVLLISIGCMPAIAEEAPLASLTLQEAKAAALRNHPAYAAAQLRALLAHESQKEAQAAYYPSATAYADAVDTGWDNTRILAGGLNNPSVYDRVGEGIAVTQLITDFGRTRNLNQGARSQAKAADQGAEASREQIILNAEANFLAALQAKAVLSVASQTLDSRRLLLEQVSALAKNKLKSELDVSFAKVAENQAELLVQKAQADAEGALASLVDAIGERQSAAFELRDQEAESGPIPDLAPLISEALANRPDLMSLRYQSAAAASVAASAKDANYPSLGAMAVAGNSYAADSHLPDKYLAAGIQLTVPLFQGGSILARQHEAEIQARVADEALREAENNVIRNVKLARLAALTARKRLETIRELLAQATEAYQLSQARYKVGSASIIELSEAQLNETSAAISLANAAFDTRIQEAVLQFEIGALR